MPRKKSSPTRKPVRAGFERVVLYQDHTPPSVSDDEENFQWICGGPNDDETVEDCIARLVAFDDTARVVVVDVPKVPPRRAIVCDTTLA